MSLSGMIRYFIFRFLVTPAEWWVRFWGVMLGVDVDVQEEIG